MSSRMTNLLRASLEDHCDAVVAVDDPVESEQLAVAEREQAVAEQEDSLECLDQVTAGLEAIADALEANRDTGLSLESAHYLNLAVKSHTDRVGFKQPVIASMESFSGSRTRVATSISLEGIQELLKQVWEMIKKVIKAFTQAVQEFIRRVTSLASSIVQRGKRLQEDVTSLTTINEDKLDLGPLAERLAIGKTPPTDLSFLQKLAENSLSVGSAVYNLDNSLTIRKVINKLEALGAKKGDVPTKHEFDNAVRELRNLKQPMASTFFKHKRQLGSKIVYSTDLMPGNTEFEMTISEIKSSDYDDAVSYALQFAVRSQIVRHGKGDGVDSTMVKALSKEDIHKVIAASIGVEELEANLERWNNASLDALKMAEEWATDGRDYSFNDDQMRQLLQLRKLEATLPYNSFADTRGFFSYYFNVMNDYLKYAEHSMAHHAKKAA